MEKQSTADHDGRTMDAQAIVHRDLESIYLGNLATVDTDLSLPSIGKHGTRFSWHSGEKLFLDDKGKVTRPTFGVGNRDVTLTVTGSFGQVKESKNFTVTIVEEQPKTKIISVRDAEIILLRGQPMKLPQVVIVALDDGNADVRTVQWQRPERVDAYNTDTLTLTGRVTGTNLSAHCKVIYTAVAPAIEKANSYRKREAFFRNESVLLSKGSIYYKAQEQMHQFLLTVNDDQMLYNFRKNAGLSTKGAPAMTGWDAPESNLRGHTTGHYLSALALAFSRTGDCRLKEKANYMVAELEKCQQSSENNQGYQHGFLSAYPEKQFDLLEHYTTYPTIWAPYYTLDKIISGLLDAYEYTGNKTALTVCAGIGSWVHRRLSRLTQQQLSEMWSIYIAGEFGGMISALVRLYRFTGNTIHLRTALLFENDKLFFPMFHHVDTLKDLHANQHIPQIIGSLNLFLAGMGDGLYYYRIAKNFWDMVVHRHRFVNGGTGEGEMFKQQNLITPYLTDKSEESCASYNLLKLTALLFKTQPQSTLMDYYENTLENHLLATYSHDRSGGTTYFMPLRPGGQKKYDTDENTCCHGTGLESRFIFQENIYSVAGDTCFINLFIPSALHWKEKETVLTQEKRNNQVTLTVSTSTFMRLMIRRPAWSKRTTISLNGKPVGATAKANGYVEFARIWSPDDRLTILFEYAYQIHPTEDDPSIFAISYGPYVLAALSKKDDYLKLHVDQANIHKQITKESGKFVFHLDDETFVPLQTIHRENYHVYFRKSRKD